MITINCKICNTTVMTQEGKRENCVDLWFELSDGSKVKAYICTNCLVNFGEAYADQIFQSIKDSWTTSMNRLGDTDEEHFARVEALEYLKVSNNDNILIDKTKTND